MSYTLETGQMSNILAPFSNIENSVYTLNTKKLLYLKCLTLFRLDR